MQEAVCVCGYLEKEDFCIVKISYPEMSKLPFSNSRRDPVNKWTRKKNLILRDIKKGRTITVSVKIYYKEKDKILIKGIN